MSETACIILAIMFWVLCALAVVCGLVWSYVQLSYMRIERAEREKDALQKYIDSHFEVEK